MAWRTIHLSCAGAALIAALGAGCASRPPAERAFAAPWSKVAATYTGPAPCADCGGIRLAVTIFPDGAYLMRWTVPGTRAAGDDIEVELGTWALAAGGDRLTLRDRTGILHRYSVTAAGSLRALDRQGVAAESPDRDDLLRDARVAPITDAFAADGVYAELDGAGDITECATGMRFPVAQRGRYLELEAAYARARSRPGERVLVRIEGRLIEQYAMDGDRLEEVVVVTRLVGLWRGRSCAPGRASAPKSPPSGKRSGNSRKLG